MIGIGVEFIPENGGRGCGEVEEMRDWLEYYANPDAQMTATFVLTDALANQIAMGLRGDIEKADAVFAFVNDVLRDRVAFHSAREKRALGES
jgi:hypothetical protein